MSITAKVKKRVIDTGRIFDVLVQGENRSHTIIFAIPNETMEVSGTEVHLKDCYFYLLYKRKGDAVPQIPLLLTKTYDLSSDTISASFEPTSYFTEKEGALEVQVFACSTEESFITGDVDIEDIALWTTFAAQISISKSQLKNSQAIVAEDMFTKGIAEMSAYLDAAEEETDEAEKFASDAEEYANGTRSDGRPVTHGTDNAKYYSEQASASSSSAAGSSTDAYTYKLGAEAARDKAQEWATKTNGKIDDIDYSAKHYAFESKASEQKASEWAEKETAVETGKYSAKHWAEQAHAEFNALDTYVDETLKPALDDYEETKEGELDTYTATKKAELDTYEGAKETELNTYTGTKKTELDTYTGTKKGELDSYVTNTNKPALDSYTNNTLKPALLTYEQTQEGTLNTYTGTKKTELDSYVTNTSKPSIDDYIDDEKKPEIDAYVEEVEGQLAEDVNVLKSQVNVVSSEVENINAILEGEADVTNTDPAEGESLLAQSRLIHHANLLHNGSFGRVGARSVAWNQLIPISSVESQTVNGVTWTNNGDGSYTANGTATANSTIILQTLSVPSDAIKKNHVYLLNTGYTDSTGNSFRTELVSRTSGNQNVLYVDCFAPSIVTPSDSGLNLYVELRVVNGKTANNLVFRPQLFDLTIMNEYDSTITDAQNIARFFSKFPASYYPTDTGHIYDLNPSGFRIRGINLWDEQIVSGGLQSDGSVDSDATRITTSFIPVSSNKAYYLLTPQGSGYNGRCAYYDCNKNLLQYNGSFPQGGSFTTPVGTTYVRITPSYLYGTVYNHDIQICLDSLPSAVKQEYHSYEGHTVLTPQIADGHYVNESCYDYVENVVEDGIVKGKKHTVVGSVDLGTLNYTAMSYRENTYWLGPNIADMKKVGNNVVPNFIHASYQGTKGVDVITGTVGVGLNSDGNIIVTNGSSSVRPTGVLYYELAEEVITDVEPLRSFSVTDYCTIEPITPQTELPNRADVPFVVETKSNNGIIEQITTNKNNIEAEVATREAQVVKLQKQIDNLNQGAGGYPEITYPDATYGTGEVPPNKAKNAQVVNLIMNSRVRNNLVNPADSSTSTVNGITFTNNGDGSWTVSGATGDSSAQKQIVPYNMKANHSYLLAGARNNVLLAYIGQGNDRLDEGSGIVATITTDTYKALFIYVRANVTLSSPVTIRPISTDLNVYFYNSDLSSIGATDSAKLATIQTNYPELLIPSDYDTGTRVDTTYEGVGSISRNRFYFSTVSVGAIKGVDGTVEEDTSWKCSDYIEIPASTNIYLKVIAKNSSAYGYAWYDASKNYISGSNYPMANVTVGIKTSPSNARYLRFSIHLETNPNFSDNVCINVTDSQDGTFTPYKTATITLPDPVTGKSAGSVHQIYYPETGEMTEPIGEHTVTSSTGINIWGTNVFSVFIGTTKKVPTNSAQKPNILLAGYIPTSYADRNSEAKAITIVPTGFDYPGTVLIRDTSCTTVEQIRSAILNQIISFELATPNPNSQATAPVIVDMIETEGGGRIEAVQTQDTKIDSSFTIGYMNI